MPWVVGMTLPIFKQTRLLESKSRALVIAFTAIGLVTAFDAAHALLGLGGSGLDDFANDWLYTGIELLAVGLCLARALLRREDRAAWLLISVGSARLDRRRPRVDALAGQRRQSAIPLDRGRALPRAVPGDVRRLDAADALALSPHRRGGVARRDRRRPDAGGARRGPDLSGGARRQRQRGLGGRQPRLPVRRLPAARVHRRRLRAVRLAPRSAVAAPGGRHRAERRRPTCSTSTKWRKGTYVEGNILDTLWPASMAVLALAAWQPTSPRIARNVVGRHTIALPALFALVALALLVSASIHPLTRLSVGLATAALLAAPARAPASPTARTCACSSAKRATRRPMR